MALTEEQNRAVTIRGKNVLLSAAAGSGKTTVLVERVLSLIRTENADIDRMLIVTFTNASAGDMRVKLRKKLNEAAEAGDEACRRQAVRLENATISTIHSFCSSFLRENFELAGVEPTFRVMDDAEERRVNESAMDRAMEEAYASVDGDLALLNRWRGPEKVRALAEKLVGRLSERGDADGWLDRCCDFDRALIDEWAQAVKRDAIATLREAIGYWKAALKEDCTDGQQKALLADIGMAEEIIEKADYEELRLWMVKPPYARASGKRGETANPAADDLRTKGKDLIKKAKIKDYPLAPSLEDLEQLRPCLRALAKIARAAMRYADETKDERGVLTYSDLEHRTLAALRTAEGENVLRDRYDYVFVDEYQDTSRLQEDVLSFAVKDGNLFNVGDVKQSIYRFRSAEPALFMRKFDDYAAHNGGELLLLTRNFRSDKAVIAFVNALFEKVMTGGDAEIVYDDRARLVPGLDERPEGPVPALHLTEGDEAELVARLIQQEKDRDPSLTWRDFAVLTRRGERDQLLVRRALERHGIPAYTDRESGFYRTAEIRLALSVLRLVLNRRSDVALIGTLRSPLVGLTVDELAAIRLYEPPENAAAEEGPEGEKEELSFFDRALAYSRTNGDGADRVRDWLAKLDSFALAGSGAGVGEIVRRAVTGSGLVRVVSALPGGERRRANLDKLCDEADAFEKNVSPLLYRFLANADRQSEKGEGDNAPMISEADDVVRLMTVHKSKGLEFRCVVAPGFDHEYSRKDSSEELPCHDDMGMGLKVSDEKLRTMRDTLPMAAIRARRRRDNMAEEMRVLYVLLTRAESRLIMTAGIKSREKVMQDAARYQACPSSCHSYLSLIMAAGAFDEKGGFPLEIVWHPSDGETDAAGEERPAAERKKPSVLPDMELLKWRYPWPDEGRRPVKLTATGLVRRAEGPEEKVEIMARPLFLEPERELTGAERGTAYHTVMRCVRFDALRGKAGTELHSAVGREIARMTDVNLLTRAEAEQVDAALVARFWESAEGQRILAAETVRREWPFNVYLDIRQETGSDADGRVAVQGVIDLCYIEDGQWVLLDYKTDRSRDVEAIKAHYKRQLDTYSRALESITGIRVKRRVLCLMGMGLITQV